MELNSQKRVDHSPETGAPLIEVHGGKKRTKMKKRTLLPDNIIIDHPVFQYHQTVRSFHDHGIMSGK